MINWSAINRLLSALVFILLVSLFLPLSVAIAYHEMLAILGFGATIFIFIFVGGLLLWLSKKSAQQDDVMSTKSGLIFVSLSWVMAACLSAIPYMISGHLGFFDAFFETASGLTTTGASVYSDIEALPKALLIWRSMTNWLGGMGIVVLTVALMPFLSIDGFRLVKAEAPGQEPEKLAFRMSATAKYLWLIYCGLTLIECLTLLWAGMPAFEAITHSLSTLATGGFSPKNDSIMGYSPLIQIIITCFMFLGGVNFSFYFWVVRGKGKIILRDSEFKAYFIIITVMSLAIASILFINRNYDTFIEALRHAAFQVVSLITTTGFISADYETWPPATMVLLSIAIFSGGCVGSTAGGVKISRLVAMVKQSLAEIRRAIYPRAYIAARFNKQIMSDNYLRHVTGFMGMYFIVLIILTFILTLSNVSILDSFLTSLSMLSNVGPGFGSLGPTESFEAISAPVKFILGLGMIIGRLEIFTIVAIMIPSFWKRWSD
jgi:trk system potassium uptake protein TrkH